MFEKCSQQVWWMSSWGLLAETQAKILRHVEFLQDLLYVFSMGELLLIQNFDGLYSIFLYLCWCFSFCSQKNASFRVTALIIPKQESTSDSVSNDHNFSLVSFVILHECISYKSWYICNFLYKYLLHCIWLTSHQHDCLDYILSAKQ